MKKEKKMKHKARIVHKNIFKYEKKVDLFVSFKPKTTTARTK